MSGDPYYNFDYSQAVKEVPKPIPHGANIEIHLRNGMKTVCHRTSTQESGIIAKVISYPDGMVVGCTFLSNESLEKLWEFHQQYIKDKQSLKHQ